MKQKLKNHLFQKKLFVFFYNQNFFISPKMRRKERISTAIRTKKGKYAESLYASVNSSKMEFDAKDHI